MKKIQFLIAIALLAGLMSPRAALAIPAATYTDSLTAPVDYTYAQTSARGTIVNNNTKAFNVGEQFELTSPLVGDTGSYYTGVELTSVDFLTVGNNSFSSTTFTLNIGTVSDGTFTSIDTEMFTGATVGSSDYISLQLYDYVQLAPNVEYAFTISSPDAIKLAGGTPATSFVGGFDTTEGATQAITVSGGTVSDVGGNRVFYLDTVPVPEPADWALVPMVGALAFFGLRRFNRPLVMA